MIRELNTELRVLPSSPLKEQEQTGHRVPLEIPNPEGDGSEAVPAGFPKSEAAQRGLSRRQKKEENIQQKSTSWPRKSRDIDVK